MKVTLTTPQAVALAKAIAPAVCTDKIKIHLQTIDVLVTDTAAVFTATDGYRLHRVTVPQSPEQCREGHANILGSELLLALNNLAKQNGKAGGDIVLSYDYGHTANIATGETSLGAIVIDVSFPACASILNPTPELDSDAYYHAPYLADIITAAGHAARHKVGKDTVEMVNLVNVHPRKPAHVRASNPVTGMEFHGVLMPCRP
jgi:hypothetical protein